MSSDAVTKRLGFTAEDKRRLEIHALRSLRDKPKRFENLYCDLVDGQNPFAKFVDGRADGSMLDWVQRLKDEKAVLTYALRHMHRRKRVRSTKYHDGEIYSITTAGLGFLRKWEAENEASDNSDGAGAVGD